MGTRGLFGFRVDNNDYLVYNHYDSYPSYLGVEVVKAVQQLRVDVNWDDVRQRVRKLHRIDPKVPPTKADIKALAKWTDLHVSEQSTSDWYCLTRGLQGDLLAVLDSGYIKLDNEFIHDSLFCEWGYIVNLDTLQLEVWRGFQEKPLKSNRYGTTKSRDGYYPCKMIGKFDLDDVTEEALLALDRDE